ncbi:MAG: RnfABCDGE type electron transport complex subunit D [Saprospiraceae bacterium]
MKTIISTSPFLHSPATTPKIMWEVVYTLLPVLGVAFYYFGLSALLVSAAAVAGCMLAERLLDKNKKSVGDGSAILTGLLLAFCLPPGFPLWMAFLGGFVSISVGKTLWGGLGQNIFNPALLGRAFLQAAFPEAITTWDVPDGRYLGLRGTNLAMPFFKGEPIDAVSAATPLSQLKFSQVVTPTGDLLFGNVSGSLGETSGLLLILLGIYLVVRKIINWRIPVSILLTAAAFSALLYFINPAKFPSPQFTVLAGGMLLGAVYMATDYVTSPLTSKGLWVYGFGIGFLVVMIRVWGGLPEGVMYAILLMNAATPLINRFMRTRVYGY